ncbi:uncharacterized protein LOC117605444 isoform X5 [Osmia lignaria lignaria]|uniref:uncharacterized protein LOC117605444 isoform X5 n=1 Tax=Osmia lignaria lignaria TaxID=1437193 RepID=UPI0014794B34|nr:uncharacterized protein LOC117605444 isoform X7 [Osmia lignaria]
MDQPLGETSTNSSKKNTEVKVGKREESEKGRGKTEKQQNVANQKGVVKFGQDPTAGQAKKSNGNETGRTDRKETVGNSAKTTAKRQVVL